MIAILGLAFRSVLNDPRKALLYILTIAFPIMIIFALMAIANGYSSQLSNLIPSYAGNRILVVNSSANSLSDSILEYSIVNELHEMGFKQVFAQILIYSNIMGDQGFLKVNVHGIDDLKRFYQYVSARVNGSMPESDFEANVGILLARRLDLNLGDEIRLIEGENTWTLRIVGMIDCKCPCDYEILTSLEGAWRIRPHLMNKASFIELEISGDYNFKEVESILMKELHGTSLLVERPFRDAAENIINATFNSVKSWSISTCFIVLVATYFVALKLSLDSEKEVLILRYIGASKRTAFSFIFLKSLLLVGLASIIGLAFGVVSAEVGFRILSIIFSTGLYEPPSLTALDILHGLSLIQLFSIIGIIYPSLKASRLEVGEIRWRSAYR